MRIGNICSYCRIVVLLLASSIHRRRWRRLLSCAGGAEGELSGAAAAPEAGVLHPAMANSYMTGETSASDALSIWRGVELEHTLHASTNHCIHPLKSRPHLKKKENKNNY